MDTGTGAKAFNLRRTLGPKVAHKSDLFEQTANVSATMRAPTPNRNKKNKGERNKEKGLPSLLFLANFFSFSAYGTKCSSVAAHQHLNLFF